MMVERVEQNTFSDQVLTTFNDLPKAIRMIDNKKVFYRESKKYYSDSALARTLSLQYYMRSCIFSISYFKSSVLLVNINLSS